MKLLDIDKQSFATAFGRSAFPINHHLAGNALFSLERLVALSRILPADRVEYNAGDLPISIDPSLTPRNGLSPEETIRRIVECRSWLVLKNVEQDPDYRELLENCLAEVQQLRGAAASHMNEKQAYIFVSSPGAVTPYHMDAEENFLLQIRRRKTMHVFDRADRAVLSDADLERFFGGAHRNLVFREECRPKARAFELAPGLGVHVPPTAPHWVQNGPEPSVSFSITFQTRDSTSRGHAYRMNARLRRLGLQPQPVGRSPLRDGIKQMCYRALAKARAV